MESQRRMSQTIEFLPKATFVIDRQRTTTAWITAREKMSGVAAADMLGRRDDEHALPLLRSVAADADRSGHDFGPELHE